MGHRRVQRHVTSFPNLRVAGVPSSFHTSNNNYVQFAQKITVLSHRTPIFNLVLWSKTDGLSYSSIQLDIPLVFLIFSQLGILRLRPKTRLDGLPGCSRESPVCFRPTLSHDAPRSVEPPYITYITRYSTEGLVVSLLVLGIEFVIFNPSIPSWWRWLFILSIRFSYTSYFSIDKLIRYS